MLSREASGVTTVRRLSRVTPRQHAKRERSPSVLFAHVGFLSSKGPAPGPASIGDAISPRIAFGFGRPGTGLQVSYA